MKVLVVSDHTLIGQSLVTSLRSLSSGEPIEASHCDPSTVIGCLYESGPDVVLLEGSIDFARAVSTARMLIGEVPDARIVVLGREADEASTYEAISAGADGYLTGEVSLDTLASTLSGVMRGELGLSRTVALRVVRQLRRAARARSGPLPLELEGKLTRREREVFDLVRRGLRSREVAEHLSIAEGTVYKHIQSILDKLQVHSRTQAIFVSAERPEQEAAANRGNRKV
jgi:DNA-binding NarL/FixJ family response regulator